MQIEFFVLKKTKQNKKACFSVRVEFPVCWESREMQLAR